MNCPVFSGILGRMHAPFWETRSLTELNRDEWEALCDGCGKCCLHKLQDGDSGEVHYTAVACRLLDLDTLRCRDYPRRTRRVSDCLVLEPGNLDQAYLPESCAYRRLAEGRPLPDWHPLVCGDPDAVRRGGHSVAHRAVSELDAGDLELYLVDWY